MAKSSLIRIALLNPSRCNIHASGVYSLCNVAMAPPEPRAIGSASPLYNLFRTPIIFPKSPGPHSSWTRYNHKHQQFGTLASASLLNPATRLRSSVSVPRFRGLTCLRSSYPQCQAMPDLDRSTLSINKRPLHIRPVPTACLKKIGD